MLLNIYFYIFLFDRILLKNFTTLYLINLKKYIYVKLKYDRYLLINFLLMLLQSQIKRITYLTLPI